MAGAVVVHVWGFSDWVPLLALLGMFVLVVGALFVDGRSPGEGNVVARLLVRIPESFERALKFPGWAGATVSMSLFGLMVAGVGLYADIAWHVDLGRDEILFTPPHTMIVIGLGIIAAAAGIGILFASLTDGPGLRWSWVRVPYSTLLLGAMGIGALVGFPLDNWWHAVYGIDVTLWSPTHLLMVAGGALSPIACWFVLAEAGARPDDGWQVRAAHVTCASFALVGATAIQGEFSFGVPQFQHLYHPVLIVLTASVFFVAARVVVGPGGALACWAGFLALWLAPMLLGQTQMGANPGFSEPRAPLYLPAAVAVELAALAVGTRRPLRFAGVAAAGVLTLGLGGEWLWQTGARQPWTTALLPDALLVGALVAAGGAVVGALIAGAALGRRSGVPLAVAAAAGVAVLAGLALPLPREVGDVEAAVTLDQRTTDRAVVHVTLDPPDAAEGARWLQVMSWQGGGSLISPLREVGPGQYVSEHSVPVTGSWKTLVRLHRGAELMAVPVYAPPDPEIGAPEVPAVDRTMPMIAETSLLLREVREGQSGSPRAVVTTAVALAVMAWIGAAALTTFQTVRRRDEDERPVVPAPVTVPVERLGR